MTTLARLPKSKLTIYAGDHNPPHFHVLANDGSEALAWASQNVAAMATQWKELNP